VLDVNGNLSETYSITFYETALDAQGGTVVPEKVVSLANYKINLPTPTRLKDIFKGWSTDSEAVMGTTEIIATENSQYYALWNPLEYIVVKEMPNKTEYSMGDSFEKEGLVLQGTYKEGQSVFVTADEVIVTGFDSVTAGVKTLTAEWGGKAVTFTVNVKKRGELTVSSATALVDSEVSITVKLNKNPGINSARLKIDYDTDVFTLIKVTDGGILGANSHSDNMTSPYTLYWVNDLVLNDYTAEGVLVTLTFKVKADATPAKYDIGLSYSYEDYDVYDSEFNPIWLDVTSGTITVKTALTGDLDQNGVVNDKDLEILTKYLANWKGFTADTFAFDAADINGDGRVNPLDRGLLARHIAGMDGYEII